LFYACGSSGGFCEVGFWVGRRLLKICDFKNLFLKSHIFKSSGESYSPVSEVRRTSPAAPHGYTSS